MADPRALRPARTSPPSALPVSLDEAKAHLRVDTTDEDVLIRALIQSVTEHLDGWAGTLGRCLVEQTWRMSFSAFPSCGLLRLPLAPLASSPAIAVTYFDDANATQTLSSSAYQVAEDDLGPLLHLAQSQTWPTTYERVDAVSVSAKFGYGAAADVPASIKAAILLMVGDLYINREAKISNKLVMNPTAAMLLAPYRRTWL